MKLTSWVQNVQRIQQHKAFPALETHSEPKKSVSSKRILRFSGRAKYILTSAAIVVILTSAFVLFQTESHDTEDIPQNESAPPTRVIAQDPTDVTKENDTKSGFGKPIENQIIPQKIPQMVASPQISLTEKSLGIIESADVVNSTIWKAVAGYAWQFFGPGAVNPETGLPGASDSFPYFTDWDLGVYIQAILDANEIGLITKEGPWGYDDRLEKVITFLENRTLSVNALPFWFYQAENGEPHEESLLGGIAGNVADSGRLLTALYNLKNYDEGFATRVNAVVYNITNYSFMLDEVDSLVSSINIYDYLVTSGFAAFWPEKTNVPPSIIDNIMSAPQVDLHGVELPVSKISCEPILHSIFDLPQHDPRILNLSRQVYLAHEAWYNETGTFRAFSEGPTMDKFAYEWVVLPDGRTWVVQNEWGFDFGTSPIIYSKVAFGFLALYNTNYAYDLVVHLENRLPELSSGYCDGVLEDGESTLNAGTGNTNGLILSAAKYAIQSGDWP